MTNALEHHKMWMKEEDYRQAYEAILPEYELASAFIGARAAAGLTQEQLAQRMNTTQSVIARLEGGRTRPSTLTLQKLAAATGMRLKISFEPAHARSRKGASK